MLFITVGTHEQSFDRLLKCIDKMVEEGIINEKIICQKGYTEYQPQNYKAVKLMPYNQIQENIKKARIVITHGGPASFLEVLKYGKIPIVVPRKKDFNEHVNNHQLEFSRQVSKRMNNIIVAENDEEIIDAIVNYEEKIKKLSSKNISNNVSFNENLIKEINNMI